MNLQKRLLSLILCLAMTLSIAAPVYAEELPAGEAPAIVAQEVEEIQETEAPAEEKAEEEKTEEAPVEEAPIEEEANAEAPVVEAPVEEAPIEVASVEETPVEEVPAEEEAPVETEQNARAIQKGSLNVTCLSLDVGEKAILTLSGAAADEFETDNKHIADVTDNGTIIAKSAGTTEITVTDTNDQEYTCVVNVDGVISNKSVTLAETKTATVTVKGGTIASVSSTNPSVATITKAGKITAVKNGTCTVTVKDTVGNTYNCKVTVTTSYLARMAKNAQYVYNLVVKLHCRPGIGSRTLSLLKKKKKVSCNAAASIAMQLSGILKYNVTMGHTEAKGGNEVKRKNTVAKAIKKTNKLIKGTYTIVRVGKKYSQLPAKYKQAGMIYIQDSNMCVSAGGGYIYSCNESSSQLRNGRYYRTKVSNGYPFTHPILYIIAPKE